MDDSEGFMTLVEEVTADMEEKAKEQEISKALLKSETEGPVLGDIKTPYLKNKKDSL